MAVIRRQPTVSVENVKCQMAINRTAKIRAFLPARSRNYSHHQFIWAAKIDPRVCVCDVRLCAARAFAISSLVTVNYYRQVIHVDGVRAGACCGFVKITKKIMMFIIAVMCRSSVRSRKLTHDETCEGNRFRWRAISYCRVGRHRLPPLIFHCDASKLSFEMTADVMPHTENRLLHSRSHIA